jgi:hypothetical protein
MKRPFKPEGPDQEHGDNLQSHVAARLRLINEKEVSSPRATLAFSALGVATWLKKKVGALATRIKTDHTRSQVPARTTSSWRNAKDTKPSA